MRHPRRLPLFLLLALWLNACLGWAQHETAHLREALQPAARTVLAAEESRQTAFAPDEEPPHGTTQIQGTCVACLAFAHLQAAVPQPAQGPRVQGSGASQRPADRARALHEKPAVQAFLARGPPAGPDSAPAASARAA